MNSCVSGLSSNCDMDEDMKKSSKLQSEGGV